MAILTRERSRSTNPRSIVVREFAATLLFFGVLASDGELRRRGEEAIQDLRKQGYSIAQSADPIRVYPLQTAGDVSAHHRGTWIPGVIRIRPDGPSRAESLRHELMHEAHARTCRAPLPLWAQEASAIAFSGEAASDVDAVSPKELDVLRDAVRERRPLKPTEYRMLRELVALRGWSDQPCSIPSGWEDLAELRNVSDRRLAGVIISAVSGRVLEQFGDASEPGPAGSLLKVLYAASLKGASPNAIGPALLKSDGAALARIAVAPDPQRMRVLYGEEHASPDTSRYLGVREREGELLFQWTLPELANRLRIAILLEPTFVSGLERNGRDEGSTLWGAAPRDLRVLSQLRALAKTGTVSSESGQPLQGTLFLAWPFEAPEFIAVFRRGGVRGARVLESARSFLQDWSTRYRIGSGRVPVLLNGVPAASWRVPKGCDEVVANRGITTSCGYFELDRDRRLYGILSQSGEILESDVESYVAGVLEAEAATLNGEARRALAGIVGWNGAFGMRRHPDKGAVCGTSHCMVFRGTPDTSQIPSFRSLFDGLDARASSRRSRWFEFSLGGREAWERTISRSALARAFRAERIDALVRVRERDGEVRVHVSYPHAQEVLPCDVMRTTLGLPSCPERIAITEEGFSFSGLGRGHGSGFAVVLAGDRAAAGWDAERILDEAYPEAE